MSDMVEKVARALCRRHYAARFCKAENDPHVKMNVKGNWQLFVEDAKAAIAAMREPTNKMMEVGCRNYYDETYNAYQAMIDAALEK